MLLKTSTKFVVLFCLVAAAEPSLCAQGAGAVKAAPASGASYSAEESGASSPLLVKKESDLRVALNDEPNSAELLYSLGWVLQQENKASESLDTYTEAARRRKPTANELHSVALDYVLLNDYEDAIRWLELAARMEPGNTSVLYALGRCYYSKDRFTDAGKVYERVLAIDPKHLKAEENLGLVYDVTNRPDKAEEALRKAASWANENGSDEWPFLDLGSFLLDQDRSREAIDPLRIAVRIRPACASCHEKLGRALLAAHDSAGGIAELGQATQLDPKNPRIHFELGRALRQAGQMERAQQELSLSQKLYGTHSQE